jgi:hypothetical protein
MIKSECFIVNVNLCEYCQCFTENEPNEKFTAISNKGLDLEVPASSCRPVEVHDAVL